MKLKCGCEINDQYLPTNGGERKFECPHDSYIIKGRRRVVVEFSVWSKNDLVELGRKLGERVIE